MEFKELSLRDAAKFDYEHKLADKKTGWGRISAARANENSATQRRRRNRKQGKQTS